MNWKTLFLLALILPTSLAYTFSQMSITVNSDGSLSISGNLAQEASYKTRVYLLGKSNYVSLTSARINGKETPVYYDYKGYYVYTNESGRVEASGYINPSGNTITVIGPVSVLDVTTPSGSQRYYSVTNKIIYLSSLSPSGKASYTFNIIMKRRKSPEFQYYIRLESPQTIDLELKNGEKVSKVSGGAYNLMGKRLIIKATSTYVEIEGTLENVSRYEPPENGYVIFQWDPLLEVDISTTASEVDLSEPGYYYKAYDTRKAYYSSGDIFKIKYQELEEHPGLVFSASSETITAAITSSGWIIEDSKIKFENTGLDYLEVKTGDWDPLYLAVEGEPRQITTKDNSLYISIPKTKYGNLEWMALGKVPLGLVSLAHLSFPTVQYPTSNVNVITYYPENYVAIPLKADMINFNWETTLVYILVLSALFYPFVKKKWRCLLVGFAVYLLANVSLVFLGIYIVSIIYLGIKGYKKKKNLWLALAIIGGIILLLFFVLILFAMFGSYTAGPGYSPPMYESKYVSSQLGLEEKINAAREAGFETKAGILPVKLELPWYSKRMSTSFDFLAKDEKPEFSVIFIQGWLWKLLLFILGVGILAYRPVREEIKHSIKGPNKDKH